MSNISIKIPSLPSTKKVEMNNFLLIEQPEGTKKAKIENLSECLNKSELSSYINEEKLPENIITVKDALDHILNKIEEYEKITDDIPFISDKLPESVDTIGKAINYIIDNLVNTDLTYSNEKLPESITDVKKAIDYIIDNRYDGETSIDLSYSNTNIPDVENVDNVKSALDYLLEIPISNLTNKINDITTLTFYYGVSSEDILSKEKLLSTLNSTDIFESDEETNQYLVDNYNNFNFSKEEFTDDKYVYIAFPYILKDLDVINNTDDEVLMFDDFNYKIMTLPNSHGYSQEFYVKKSIDTINMNKTFTLEFEKKPY